MARALVNALFIRTTVHEGAHFRARQLGSVSSSSLLSIILAELKKTKFLGRISRFLLLYTSGVPFGVVVYSPTNYTPILPCPRNLELWDSAAPV